MPKQINTYTFGQALVQKFGLKGRFQPVLDETIVPVTVVDAEGASRPAAGGGLSTASGAGNQGRIFLFNPANSAILITVKRWWAVSGAPTTDFLQLTLSNTTGTTSGHREWRDSRLAGLPVASITSAASAAIVLGGPQYHLDVDSWVWEEEWFLYPGSRLEFRQNAQNTTLDVWLDWEESNLVGGFSA